MMKKFGYWFVAYGIVLLGIIFLWSFLLFEQSADVQTSAKVRNVRQMKYQLEQTPGGAATPGTGENQDGETEPETTEIPTSPPAKPPVSSKTNTDKNNKSKNEPKKKKKSKSNTKKSKSKKSKSKKSKVKKNKTKKDKKKRVIRGNRLNVYYSVRIANSKKRIKIDRSEVNVLERIVQAEAGGQDEKGRILVANVILNRLKRRTYPKTIQGVVFAYSHGYYQFSPVMDGRYYSVKVSNGTKKAVRKALEGADYSKGALYFMNRRSASRRNAHWFDTRLRFVLKHGGHEFFK